ncbi:MAG: hypothetical protein KIT43_10630 [Bauldia sp.]|nr:hypothetical protein [Bauldia sp.]MCW5717700.1 hypothetical protein [Bauldia sp.]
MKRLLLATAALVMAGGLAYAQPVVEAPAAEAPAISEEAALIIRLIGFACDEFAYETECFAEIRVGLEGAAALDEADQLAIHAHVRTYKVKYEYLAAQIDAILTEFDVPLEDPA